MDATAKKVFLTKLAALLTEYNVHLGFDVSDSSDTHGIRGEKVTLADANQVEFFSVNGWDMTARDIIRELAK